MKLANLALELFAASHPNTLSELPAEPEALSQLQLCRRQCTRALAETRGLFPEFSEPYVSLMQQKK